ncbi:MAG: hypothetical protein ACRCY9_21000, partial [Phycicoccus sp.]
MTGSPVAGGVPARPGAHGHVPSGREPADAALATPASGDGPRAVRATGVGSWPGTSSREAVRTVRDLLLDGDGLGIPYLPETPARGPGADLVGRGAGLLVDLP